MTTLLVATFAFAGGGSGRQNESGAIPTVLTLTRTLSRLQDPAGVDEAEFAALHADLRARARESDLLRMLEEPYWDDFPDSRLQIALSRMLRERKMGLVFGPEDSGEPLTNSAGRLRWADKIPADADSSVTIALGEIANPSVTERIRALGILRKYAWNPVDVAVAATKALETEPTAQLVDAAIAAVAATSARAGRCRLDRNDTRWSSLEGDGVGRVLRLLVEAKSSDEPGTMSPCVASIEQLVVNHDPIVCYAAVIALESLDPSAPMRHRIASLIRFASHRAEKDWRVALRGREVLFEVDGCRDRVGTTCSSLPAIDEPVEWYLRARGCWDYVAAPRCRMQVSEQSPLPVVRSSRGVDSLDELVFVPRNCRTTARSAGSGRVFVHMVPNDGRGTRIGVLISRDASGKWLAESSTESDSWHPLPGRQRTIRPGGGPTSKEAGAERLVIDPAAFERGIVRAAGEVYVNGCPVSFSILVRW